MANAVLLIASPRIPPDACETLRLQDTAGAILRAGREVDVLVPRVTPLLTAALPPDARVHVPRMRCGTLGLSCEAIRLLRKHPPLLIHAFGAGFAIARFAARFARDKPPIIAEIRRSDVVNARACTRASAIILAEETIQSQLAEVLPMARVSVIPDPHAELSADAFTFAEFADALDRIYDYAIRRPK